ncbi:MULTISPECIES: hypothetical protein [unclassified Mesorhizobium]|uniref:hypothetical protein n=1 Tax=unclassified Mesorhizobium TaxID=325217 RepID=UPI0016755875|nr:MULTISPECIES: hypothetical protein [unclassified Mesorhizobium]
MTPEPRTVTNAALDKLPLFATDLEIAIAIVGKQNASRWKRDVIPALERRGFPKWDSLHQGRAVPHVRQFYALYLGITAGFTMAPPPDGVDKVGSWRPRDQNRDDSTASHAPGTNPGTNLRRSHAQRKAEAKANAEAWAVKKRNALEAHRAKRAAESANGQS